MGGRVNISIILVDLQMIREATFTRAASGERRLIELISRSSDVAKLGSVSTLTRLDYFWQMPQLRPLCVHCLLRQK